MLLAQLVVEYVADVSGLQKGVTGVAQSMKSMEGAASSSAGALGFVTDAAVALVLQW